MILSSTVKAPGQSESGLIDVIGIVSDVNGEVVQGAKVILRRQEGAKQQSTRSDAKGSFRFARIAFGIAQIEVEKEAFKPAIIQVNINALASAPVRVVLEVADLQEELTVSNQSAQVNTNPAENRDVIKLDRNELSTLPVFDNDVIRAVSSLADASSTGSGGPSVIVDGLEVTSKVPASMIQEVRINQNPYSAEFARPGRGRIEVITRAGMTEYHGEFGFIFRDSHLDARNAFALERAPEQRRIFDGTLTGPIGHSKKTSFFFAGNHEEEDLQAVVYAETPSGIVSENVATPQRQSEFSFRINHQFGEKTTFSVRLDLNQDSNGNTGAGGFNLPEVAANSTGGEHHVFFTLRQILSPKLINELTSRIGHEYGRTRSVTQGVPRLVVQDAFTGGGGQVNRRSTENHVQLNEILSWTEGKHFVRAGVNIPDISRRGYSDQSNFGGTFTFATLDDYVANRPFLYSINEGDGHLAFWQKEFGMFVQDLVLVRANLSIAAGLRYDHQNYLSDHNNFAPRLSFAYAPSKQRKTILRGGAGIFYDRTGVLPIADMLRFDGQRLRQVNLSNPGYPDPFSNGGTLANQPVSIVRFDPYLSSPYTFQFNAGVERQINKSLTVSANYINTRGIRMFRSRDINAPLPGAVVRPDPTIGVLRQVESSALGQTHMLELMVRGNVTRYFNGTIQYNLGRAHNDTGGINVRPANNYDLSGEWSRANFDEFQHFNMLGTFKMGSWFKVGTSVSLASGRPYTLTTGRDDNLDTVATDRPAGVRRNSLQGPGEATVDLRWSKEFFFRSSKNGKKADEGPSLVIGLSAFNVLNRVNFTGYVGNLSSSFFGLPVASRPARRLQLNVNFNF